MYRSEMHDILLRALDEVKWIRSTKDEDNFRQVLCAAIYRHISPNNVEIPSTRSAKGDIGIFNRKIELKYASNEKEENLDDIIEDLDDLLDGKIEFAIVAARLDTSKSDHYVHSTINLPRLGTNAPNAAALDHTASGRTYKRVSVFLAATYPHAITTIAIRKGKGNNSTAYMSFESASSLCRSSFLDVSGTLLHVDVVGSKEDGLVAFLFKRAENVRLDDGGQPPVPIEIPHAGGAIQIATAVRVTSYSVVKKFAAAPLNEIAVEDSVLCFTI